jgi:D-3-phosphoglycerate dehydrogenase
MNKVVVLDTGYETYRYEKSLFEANGYAFNLYEGPPAERGLKISFPRDATGILVRSTLIDREAMVKMPGLKAIVRYGTGFENIDLDAAFERGIRVANVQGYANHAVSDHALGLMFACIRGILDPWPSDFGKPPLGEIFELHDKTLGIIGIGRIGSQFSRKASPLFRETLAYDPYKTAKYTKEAGAVKTELPELLERSRVISIHCNLSPETFHLLDRKAFSHMKQKPVVINTARGPVIESSALLRALDEGRIHSAGVDVFEEEPPGPAEEELIRHPRIIATPHVAWYSVSAMKELQKRAADNLLALLQGRDIEDEIIP